MAIILLITHVHFFFLRGLTDRFEDSLKWWRIMHATKNSGCLLKVHGNRRVPHLATMYFSLVYKSLTGKKLLLLFCNRSIKVFTPSRKILEVRITNSSSGLFDNHGYIDYTEFYECNVRQFARKDPLKTIYISIFPFILQSTKIPNRLHQVFKSFLKRGRPSISPRTLSATVKLKS